MRKRTLDDLSDAALEGARVLARVDFNVPISNGQVSDDTRIRATLPTIQRLVERGARVILMAHLGRPGGEAKPEFSLRPVADRLTELLDTQVEFVNDLVGERARAAVERLEPRRVLLLENTRFLPGETANEAELAGALASLGDVYVNDAFGAAHRAHASTTGVATAMRERGKPAVAGLLMERELRFFARALEEPDHPFVAVLGGAKVSGKIDVIDNLLPRAERLLVGGAMANTFFRALGLRTGESLVEEDRIDAARETAERAGDKLVLPVDCVVEMVETGGGESSRIVVDRDEVPDGGRIMDIGPATVAVMKQLLTGTRTIIWNGPMGVFEDERFRTGTNGIARAVAEATDRGASSIVGGGETAAAVRLAGMADRMTHVSTGGGASLELLEGKELPGVAALSDREGEAGG